MWITIHWGKCELLFDEVNVKLRFIEANVNYYKINYAVNLTWMIIW